MRWVVVAVMLAGCFSRPTLARGDGGADDDGGTGDGALGDGGTTDTPLDGCAWVGLGQILDDPTKDERHPWMSFDGNIVTFWTGDAPGNTGVMWQAERASSLVSFGTPIRIYPQTGETAPAEGDPALTHGLLKMYIHTSSGILAGTRAMPNGIFQNLMPDSALTNVMTTRNVQEGGFITDDDQTFLFVAGDNADTYNSEDLYIASRTGTSMVFGTPKPYDHNVIGKNECCPTMAGNVLMYERDAGGGKHEIVSSIYNGSTFSPPAVVVLPGSDSKQQPSLSADGQHLVYVVNSGNDWHLEEARLECAQ